MPHGVQRRRQAQHAATRRASWICTTRDLSELCSASLAPAGVGAIRAVDWTELAISVTRHLRSNAVMQTADSETLAKVEVLADLEQEVHELMVAHEAKRILWFPSELLAPAPDTDPDAYVRQLRENARGISMPGRVALALNLLTEEGLPHFHRLLAVYLGSDSFWSKWTNLWTAEEDRHGAVLHLSLIHI